MTTLELQTAQPEDALRQELLAIGDTKLVLGNWYSECVINGRALPDFAALLGMANANFGHARALYKHIAKPQDYAWLERGRGEDEIASMNMLDRAPADWEDFLAAAWLAEQATWQLSAGFLKGPDRTVAGLVRRIGQEVYFHLKYFEGWLSVLSSDAERVARFQRHFASRFPQALEWLRDYATDDVLTASGMRAAPLEAVRKSFISEVAKGAAALGQPLQMSEASATLEAWDYGRRRSGGLPPGLFEVIRFKDPALAH